MFHTPRLLRRVHLTRNLVSSVLKTYARLFRHRYMVERRMGVLLLLDQINAVDRNLLFRGVWEEEQIDALAALTLQHPALNKGAVFLDIGAHSGLYSLVLASRLPFEAIVAYEPAPANLVQLRANLWINDALAKVRVVEQAVADKPGRASFVVSLAKNRGHSRILEGEAEAGETLIDVEVTTVDATLDVTGKLVVAKIDVEGGETKVLEGMEATLRRNAAVLQVEYFAGPVEELDRRLAPLDLRRVRSLGYDHFYVKD
ncbi:FkbM family methyltransferase [Alsobacter sp. SYSU M60028]|uniref:FkbM family methyltransferase n=1 Tax=Alsobacter ponti TaxID=2962936 RepID=A0ABT1LF41_9HYPH|nr:FkbM family methyltransferase [Alsobacter ponti]MCP8940110.1 FkbM family methyltransferase [Alsobacter ponti]